MNFCPSTVKKVVVAVYDGNSTFYSLYQRENFERPDIANGTTERNHGGKTYVMTSDIGLYYA
jgi:hypothetical protein